MTGATRGIGLAVVRTLDRGVDPLDTRQVELVVAGRDADATREVAASVGGRAVVLDLARPEGLSEALTSQDVPDVDALVHVAGVEGTAAVADLDVAALARVLSVNLTGPVELTRLLLPGLRRRRGHLVVVGSTASTASPPVPGWGAYTASKAALRAWTDTVRVEEATHGVRVSTVTPGRTDTDMQRDIATARGRAFDPSSAMHARTVAAAVVQVLRTPPDAVVEDLRIAPAPGTR